MTRPKDGLQDNQRLDHMLGFDFEDWFLERTIGASFFKVSKTMKHYGVRIRQIWHTSLDQFTSNFETMHGRIKELYFESVMIAYIKLFWFEGITSQIPQCFSRFDAQQRLWHFGDNTFSLR